MDLKQFHPIKCLFIPKRGAPKWQYLNINIKISVNNLQQSTVETDFLAIIVYSIILFLLNNLF